MGPDAGTIFALATARGRAGIAVIRVSGPAAGLAAMVLGGSLPTPRTARLTSFRDDLSGETIDRGIVLWFPGPASMTGEDVAELQIHGGPAVVAALLGLLGRLPGCRPAEPGEFTRRAFENGKLDLTQAEAVADLVAAETASQRRQARRQADGAVARLTDDWGERLVRSLAYLEAGIDFPDEALFAELLAEGKAEVAAVAAEVAAHLADGRRGEILRDGLSVAIVGPPNSGKSSLLNRLAGRDAAIVSAVAGTTRDVIEVHLDLAGYPVILADTAGLRDAADAVEAEGVRRARARAESADLRLVVLDATASVSRETFSNFQANPTIYVWNKADLAQAPGEGIAVSALTGAGIDQLIESLGGWAETLIAGPAPIVTRVRHRHALDACVQSLTRAAEGVEAALIAEDLRLAVRALGRITGQVDVEDLLDVIFRDFCIGK